MAKSAAEELRALNAICPYFTMFPIDFPLRVLAGVKEGLVVDPFCGRGTTNLAARYLGLATVGTDSSPVAVAATAAKTTHKLVCAQDVVDLATLLTASQREPELPEGEFWSLAFHPETLLEVCAIRKGLEELPPSDTATALRAVMLGSLHGPMRKGGGSSYLSNQAPRTFAPKPRYAATYWRRHGLTAPRVRVVDVVQLRARRAFQLALPTVEAGVNVADSRSANWTELTRGLGRVRWVVTSPPYYGLRTYRPDQWLREWFLGGAPEVNYTAAGQLRHSSPSDFAGDLSLVWRGLAEVAASDAKMVVRFGAINDRPVKAADLARLSVQGTGWRVDEVCSAGVATAGKRQARSFGRFSKPAIEEVDVWCSRAA